MKKNCKKNQLGKKIQMSEMKQIKKLKKKTNYYNNKNFKVSLKTRSLLN